MKALVGAFNQEKALVGAFSVIVKTDCETDGSFYSTMQDGTMMIEADVSMGPGGEPIMAHPPATQSDLTLQQFLDTVITVWSKQSCLQIFYLAYNLLLGD